MMKVRFRNSVASAPRISTAVVGSVEVEVVEFNFDSTWDGLDIWACFRNDGIGSKEYHVHMADSHIVMVPWEVLVSEGSLYVGAIGYKDGVVVKPTTWSNVATVEQGVNPEGEISKEPTPNAFEQLAAEVAAKKSAYELAVENGYEGTAEEYGELLGEVSKSVRTINGVGPDKDGNVVVEIPESTSATPKPSRAFVGQLLQVKETDIYGDVKSVAAVGIDAKVLEPIACTYGHYDAPIIPVDMLKEYPYVVAPYPMNIDYPVLTLYMFKSPQHLVRTQNGGLSLFIPAGTPFAWLRFKAYDNYDEVVTNTLVADEDTTLTASSASWANYEVLDPSGNVVRQPSDPVPVYETSESGSWLDDAYAVQTLIPLGTFEDAVLVEPEFTMRVLVAFMGGEPLPKLLYYVGDESYGTMLMGIGDPQITMVEDDYGFTTCVSVSATVSGGLINTVFTMDAETQLFNAYAYIIADTAESGGSSRPVIEVHLDSDDQTIQLDEYVSAQLDEAAEHQTPITLHLTIPAPELNLTVQLVIDAAYTRFEANGGAAHHYYSGVSNLSGQLAPFTVSRLIGESLWTITGGLNTAAI